MTSLSSHFTIETAVPLCYIDVKENRNCPLPSPESQQTTSTTPSTSRYRWNCSSFVLGAISGLIVTGQAYLALKLAIHLYGKDLQMPTDKGFTDIVQYFALRAVSHLADIFYVLICIGFAWILTSNGHSFSQRLAKSIFATSEEESQEKLGGAAARDVFLLVVCLEGGFLFGASCMGLVVEVFLNVPLSWTGFGSAIVVDAIVCSLMVQCYDWGSEVTAVVNDDEETQSKDNIYYIAIV